MANPEAEGAGRTPRKKPQDREGTPGKSYKVERVVILFRINQDRVNVVRAAEASSDNPMYGDDCRRVNATAMGVAP